MADKEPEKPKPSSTLIEEETAEVGTVRTEDSFCYHLTLRTEQLCVDLHNERDASFGKLSQNSVPM